MPIAEINTRLIIIRQDHYKRPPGCDHGSWTSESLIYPEEVSSTPEELFEAFKRETDPTIFEEVEIPDGRTISNGTYCKAFVAFVGWLKDRGFQPFRELENNLPVLKIPAQVTLTGLRSHR
jgi:hypothetical protein